MTTLASLVALSTDGDPSLCPAWMDAADRRCGKPVTVAGLCSRHHKVALTRLAKQEVKDAREKAVAVAKGLERLPVAEDELQRVESRLLTLDPLMREDRDSPESDPAQVNIPFRRRMISDARIEVLARLHEKRERLAAEVARLRVLTGGAA